MALQGPIPVEFALVFPDGVYAAGVFEPVRDFDASKDGRFVQSKDKASGLPLWQVEVIDADQNARTRTVKVCEHCADEARDAGYRVAEREPSITKAVVSTEYRYAS